MKRLVLAGLVGLLAAGLAGHAWAEQLPWGQGGAAKKDDAAPAAPGTVDLKKDLDPTLYGRAIKPIEAQIEQAEKVMALHQKEMEKPEAKRNLVQALGYKNSAARLYLAAMQKAKAGANIVTKPEQKQAILDQYEKPSRDKAIALLLEVAQFSHEQKDLRTAYATYKQVIQIDAENTQAKEAIAALEKEAKEAIPRKGSRGTGGGGGDKGLTKDPNAPEDRGQQDGTERDKGDDPSDNM